ncbi:unnamed protein product [Sphagnum jensenii]|uniref:Uncharacterized protein n=1 Tax=Sphagnum jensenii TaxID=128206 RepID=A0ABP1AJ82_9BRYO
MFKSNQCSMLLQVGKNLHVLSQLEGVDLEMDRDVPTVDIKTVISQLMEVISKYAAASPDVDYVDQVLVCSDPSDALCHAVCDEIGTCCDGMEHLDYETNKVMAVVLIQSVLSNSTMITVPEMGYSLSCHNDVFLSL